MLQRRGNRPKTGLIRSSSSLSNHGQTLKRLFMTKKQGKDEDDDKPFNGSVQIIRDISELTRTSLSMEDLRVWQEMALKNAAGNDQPKLTMMMMMAFLSSS